MLSKLIFYSLYYFQVTKRSLNNDYIGIGLHICVILCVLCVYVVNFHWFLFLVFCFFAGSCPRAYYSSIAPHRQTGSGYHG